MHVRRQLSVFQFQIYTETGMQRAHSGAWAAEQAHACATAGTLIISAHIYGCCCAGTGGQCPPGMSPSSCTAHVSWQLTPGSWAWSFQHTHTHMHSATSLSLYLKHTQTRLHCWDLQWQSVRSSSVTPHGVTCFWTYNYFSQLFLQKKTFSTIVYTEYDVDSRGPRKTGFHNLE